MPITPGPSWKHFSVEEKEACVKRIGNLALLKQTINVEAGNDSFTFKSSFYRASRYARTVQLAAVRKWTPEEIEARQSRLAALAVKAWPLK